MTALDEPHRAPSAQTPASRWPGYAAAALAFVSAAFSLYWVLGGTAGLSSLGGRIEELGRARDPEFIRLVWVIVAVKTAAGITALALVQPWGRRLPHRWLLFTAWIGAAVLTLYGGLQETVLALVRFGFITATRPQDPAVQLWRLLLWEPWFIAWGILLGLAAWRAHRRPGRV